MHFSTEPLTYIPVRHTCGHFELRLMRWYGGAASRERGYECAGGPCTKCKPLGRPAEDHYQTLDEARAAAEFLNATRETK